MLRRLGMAGRVLRTKAWPGQESWDNLQREAGEEVVSRRQRHARHSARVLRGLARRHSIHTHTHNTHTQTEGKHTHASAHTLTHTPTCTHTKIYMPPNTPTSLSLIHI